MHSRIQSNITWSQSMYCKRALHGCRSPRLERPAGRNHVVIVTDDLLPTPQSLAVPEIVPRHHYLT